MRQLLLFSIEFEANDEVVVIGESKAVWARDAYQNRIMIGTKGVIASNDVLWMRKMEYVSVLLSQQLWWVQKKDLKHI